MILDSLQTMSIIIAMNTSVKPKPILKWAGGKQYLSRFLVERFPIDFKRYYEPFLGGGSVLLELQPSTAVVGDLNDWLLDTYEAVRIEWQSVAAALDRMENSKIEYMKIRKKRPQDLAQHERAAQLIYLNKTCFRGLFRVNRKGEFNVPYGAYNRRYYTTENLQAFSEILRAVEIRRGDFEICLQDVNQQDFVYFDPPYYKLGGYSDFNRYTPEQFRLGDHYRLAAFCRELDMQGVRWALSNSNTALIRKLFLGYNIVSVNARRDINLNSEQRRIQELLITNF